MTLPHPKYHSILVLSLLLLIQYLGWQLLGDWNWFSQTFYPHFYSIFYPFWTRVFGWIPFSVGDIFYSLVAICLIYNLIKTVQGFLNINVKWRKYVGHVLIVVNVMYFSFHALWGMNYYRKSLMEVLPNVTNEIPLTTLKLISNDLLQKSRHYRSLCQEDENGVFTYDVHSFYEQNKDLNYTFLPYKRVPFYSKKKKSLFSFVLRYAGILGYYNPFTGEAQYTTKVPATTLPFSLAHEQAHQMGYAPEYEANFVGYLTEIQSDNVSEKYSANYKALRYILSEIYDKDSLFVQNSVKQYSEGMIRDRDEALAFQQKYSGNVEDAFSAMNNAYLQSNNQPEGLKSYNRFVELLVAFYRMEQE